MKKLLLIEDDLILARLYTCRLALDNIQVHHAEDGLKGLKALEEYQPDAIIVDLVMPGLNGTK
jgi:DNA-binding response OmpR family regulator